LQIPKILGLRDCLLWSPLSPIGYLLHSSLSVVAIAHLRFGCLLRSSQLPISCLLRSFLSVVPVAPASSGPPCCPSAASFGPIILFSFMLFLLVLCSWGWMNMQSKLFSISAYNGSTNDSAITTLKRNLGRRNLILLKGQHLYICCGAHILNLMDLHDTNLKLHESIKYIKGSPKQLHSFKDCIRTVGLNGTKKLTYDVPTRWNFTYVMLRDALFYKDAFQHLASIDPNYINLPFDDEWSYATSLCQFLKLFYNVTNIFSTTRNITSNEVFEETHKVHNHLHTYHVVDNDYIRTLVYKMQENFDKYWKNDYNVVFAIAFVIYPRSKLGYLKYVLDINEVDAMVQYERVETSLHKLYAEYKNVYGTNDEEKENENETTPLWNLKKRELFREMPSSHIT
ncbi:Zinc finger BED domain-containing protein RICESLEEPER 2, partial [Nymphaea thermarum]